MDSTLFNYDFESIMDNLHQIRVFRELGTTWGEDRETFVERRLDNIENALYGLEYEYNEALEEIGEDEEEF